MVLHGIYLGNCHPKSDYLFVFLNPVLKIDQSQRVKNGTYLPDDVQTSLEMAALDALLMTTFSTIQIRN